MRAKKGSSPVSLTAGFAGAGGLFLSCCLLFPLSAGNSSLPQLKALVQFKGNLFVLPGQSTPVAPSINGASHADPHSDNILRGRGARRGLGCRFCPVPSPYHNGTSTCGYSDVCLGWGDEEDEAAVLGGRGPRGQLPSIHILECRTPLGRLKTTTCGVPRDVGKGDKEEGFSGGTQFKAGSPSSFELGVGGLGLITAGTESGLPGVPSEGRSTAGAEGIPSPWEPEEPLPQLTPGDALPGEEPLGSEAQLAGVAGALQTGAPLGSQEEAPPPALAYPGLGGQGEEVSGEHMREGSIPDVASRAQTVQAPVRSGHGMEHAEEAKEQVPSVGGGPAAGTTAPAGGAPPSEARTGETRPAARATRAVPVGLEEFKRNMAMAAAAAAAAVTGTQSTGATGEEGGARGAPGAGAGGAFVSRVYADGSRYNYASATHGAKVAATNPETKRPNAVLDEDKDKYLRVPCSTQDKFLVIELSEFLTRVDTIVVSNFEYYASSVKEFEVWGSSSYPTDRWVLLGTFCAKDVRKAQTFDFPENEGHVRYIMIRWLSHHGSEFYCTLSLVRIFGLDELESLREEMLAINGGGGAGGAARKGGVLGNPVFDRGAAGPPFPSKVPAGSHGEGPRMALGGGKGLNEEEDDDFLGRTVASLDEQGAPEAALGKGEAQTAQAGAQGSTAFVSPGAGRPSAPNTPSGHQNVGPVPRVLTPPSPGGEVREAQGTEKKEARGTPQEVPQEVSQETQGERDKAGDQGPSSAGRASAGAGGTHETGEAVLGRAPGVDKDAGEQAEHLRTLGGGGSPEQGHALRHEAAQEENGNPGAAQDDVAAGPSTLQAPVQPAGDGEAGVRETSAVGPPRDTPEIGDSGVQQSPPSGRQSGPETTEPAAACKGEEAHTQGGCTGTNTGSEALGSTPSDPSGEGVKDGGRVSEGVQDLASPEGRGSQQPHAPETVGESRPTLNLSASAPPGAQAASPWGAQTGEGAARDSQGGAARDSQVDVPQGDPVSNQSGTADAHSGGPSVAAASSGGSRGQEPLRSTAAAHSSVPSTGELGRASLQESPHVTSTDGTARQDFTTGTAEKASRPEAPASVLEHLTAAGTAGTMGSDGAAAGRKEVLPESPQGQGVANEAGPGEARSVGQEQTLPEPSAGGQAQGRGQAAAPVSRDASADAQAPRHGSAQPQATPALHSSEGTPAHAPEPGSAGTPDPPSAPGVAGTGGSGAEARPSAFPKSHPMEAAARQAATDAGAAPAAAAAAEEGPVASDAADAQGTSGPSARVAFPAPETPAPGADTGMGGGAEGGERAAGRVGAHEGAGSLDEADASSALAATPGTFQGGATPGASSASAFPSVAGLGGAGSITGGGTAAVSGLKALMLKLRALEQNQSVLEQYVENLGRSYAEGLTDLDSEIASLHSHVGRLSQASDSLTATLRQAEDKRQSEMLALQHGMRSRSHQLEVHIQLLRAQVAAVERQMHFFLGLSLATALCAVVVLLASCVWRRPTWDFVP